MSEQETTKENTVPMPNPNEYETSVQFPTPYSNGRADGYKHHTLYTEEELHSNGFVVFGECMRRFYIQQGQGVLAMLDTAQPPVTDALRAQSLRSWAYDYGLGWIHGAHRAYVEQRAEPALVALLDLRAKTQQQPDAPDQAEPDA